MSCKWAENPAPGIAYQIPGQGYIPYGPGQCGRHIQDDYGFLQQSLPQHMHDYEPRGLEWRIWWGYDIQYMYH